MPLDADVRHRLEGAVDGATSWHEIYGRLRDAVPDGEELRYRGLIWAFGYDLVSPSDPERRAREGSAFGAMCEFAEGRIPPRLADVPQQEIATWVDACTRP